MVDEKLLFLLRLQVSFSKLFEKCCNVSVNGCRRCHLPSHSQLNSYGWKRKASVVLFVPHPLRKIISIVSFVFLVGVVLVLLLGPHILAVDDVEGNRIRLYGMWRKESRECANVKNTNLLCSFGGP